MQAYVSPGRRSTTVKVHLTRIANIALSPLEEGEAEKYNEEPGFGKPLALNRLFYR